MKAILFLIIGACIGAARGWAAAHHTVAIKCDRLGGFFVGKKIYKCVQVEEKNDAAE